ncbi:hypothetical protein QR98_0102350 [Sarcoptes scabiei]|uniref:Torsin-like protein n=1 Tax=Sarcoptes scabiei TaxID=52283 RepID=A0A132AKY1_SARSC|nr:hypothetical protein QR98_0102350 [Sarcoptes scabiei]
MSDESDDLLSEESLTDDEDQIDDFCDTDEDIEAIENSEDIESDCDPAIENLAIRKRAISNRETNIEDQPVKINDLSSTEAITPHHSICSFKFILKLFVGLTIIILIYNLFGGEIIHQSIINDDVRLRKEIMEDLKKEINTSIPNIGLKTTKNIFEKYIPSNDAVPLLILGNSKQQGPIKRLAARFAESVARLKSIQSITTRSSALSTSEAIIKLFEENFNKTKDAILVIEDFEMLSPTLLMTFHQYFDNNQAKIKPIFTIMTIKHSVLDEKPIQNNLSSKDLDSIVQNVFYSLFSETFERVDIDCMINRIGVHALTLMPAVI